MPARSFRWIARRLTYANVVATIALLCALGGTAYAAGIGSGGILDNSIQSRDIKDGAVGSADLATGGIQLADISAAARAALKGAAGKDGAPGDDGVNGRDGAQGPQGPQGPAGTQIDSISDLAGVACTSGPRTGVVAVIVAGAPTGSTAAITLRCDLAPLTCGAQPANAHATFTCDGQTGLWTVVSCATDYWNINGQASDGCEYHNVYTGPEVCDGLDNDSNGVADEGLGTTSVFNGVISCSLGVHALNCNPGWFDVNDQTADGCEAQEIPGDCRGPGGVTIDNTDIPFNPWLAEGIMTCNGGNPEFVCQTDPGAIPPGHIWESDCDDPRT